MSDPFLRAIVHVDGDAFFASCEVARNPRLHGKPVAVGGARGIVLALTYEAKARGIVRGMPTHVARQMVPELVVLPGEYGLYKLFAQRMYRIVERHAPVVERYSIDECFADVSQCADDLEGYWQMASTIQNELHRDLGISFSVGLAPSKVLAKVASKYRKPGGLVLIPPDGINAFLTGVSVSKVWGIGPQSAALLRNRGIERAAQFAALGVGEIRGSYARPLRDIWAELRGISVFQVSNLHTVQQSLAATRTFRPPTTDKSTVRAELALNVEEACARARQHGLSAGRAHCFLKSQDFQYLRFEVSFGAPTNATSRILEVVLGRFDQLFAPGIKYRATGITLSDLKDRSFSQAGLFGPDLYEQRLEAVYGVVDALGRRFGDGIVHCAAAAPAAHQLRPRIFSLPMLGEVY